MLPDIPDWSANDAIIVDLPQMIVGRICFVECGLVGRQLRLQRLLFGLERNEPLRCRQMRRRDLLQRSRYRQPLGPRFFELIEKGFGLAKNEDWIQIAKPKAVELGEGAIIFRWGDKLYLIEGDPNAPIQTMKPFQDNWNVFYLKDLKDFQDNWATSYFKDQNAANTKAGKDFQDKWNVSYMKAMKDFIDNWTITYMKNQNASYMKNQNASYLKDFQDNWAVSYVKALQDFQDNWNVSYMKNQNASYMKNQNASYMMAIKDFQDNWANSYMKNQNAVYMKNQNASYTNALKDFQDNWATSYMK